MSHGPQGTSNEKVYVLLKRFLAIIVVQDNRYKNCLKKIPVLKHLIANFCKMHMVNLEAEIST